jgi:uncharacterized protein YbaR (Trm112 family)
LSLVFRESKEVAKVSGLLIKDRVGLWFSARVGIPRIIEDAVQTAAQIRSTPQTRIPPPDPILNEDFPLALITRFHSHAPGSVLIRHFILVQAWEEVNLLEVGSLEGARRNPGKEIPDCIQAAALTTRVLYSYKHSQSPRI